MIDISQGLIWEPHQTTCTATTTSKKYNKIILVVIKDYRVRSTALSCPIVWPAA